MAKGNYNSFHITKNQNLIPVEAYIYKSRETQRLEKNCPI